MTRLLLLLTLLIGSCKTEIKKSETDKEIKIIKQYDYRIIIDIANGFSEYESKFILDNSRIYTYDSTEKSVSLTKPLTLYYISFTSKKDKKNKNIRTLIPTDTVHISFSKNLSDTLFLLTKDFFKSVDFNNYDTVGQMIPVITDDSNGMIEMSYGGRKLSATINSIHNPTIGTKQLDKLLNFVDKFRPTNK